MELFTLSGLYAPHLEQEDSLLTVNMHQLLLLLEKLAIAGHNLPLLTVEVTAAQICFEKSNFTLWP